MSHLKNVVLPAFHGTVRGEGGPASQPTGGWPVLHEASPCRGGTYHILSGRGRILEILLWGAKQVG